MTLSAPEELQELAALYALGLLEETQRPAFESRLAEDREAAALALKYRQASEALLESVPAVTPPPGVRERLLARLPGGSGESLKPEEFFLSPGILLVRGQQKPWEETGIPGIRRKTLFHDPERNYASSLVSMSVGSVLPRHLHADIEELYMLSGQVRLSGQTLRMGDYCRADPGSLHDEVVAESDCVFIAMASTRNDYRLPSPARA